MSASQKYSFLLYRARDAREGALLQAMLGENNIDAWVSGGQAALGFGELGADALLVDVRVGQDDAEEARRLVEGFWKDDQRADQGPWMCEACGEGNDTGFDTCWSCQAERPEVDSTSADSAGAEAEPETTEPEPEVSARWSGWHVRVLRLLLAVNFVIWVGWACLALCRTFIPPILSRLGATGSDGQSLHDLLLTIGFLVLWLPVTYFLLRWGLAEPRPLRKAVEMSGVNG